MDLIHWSPIIYTYPRSHNPRSSLSVGRIETPRPGARGLGTSATTTLCIRCSDVWWFLFDAWFPLLVSSLGCLLFDVVFPLLSVNGGLVALVPLAWIPHRQYILHNKSPIRTS